MKSMTGFGAAEACKKKLSLDLKLRSLNGKFLSVQVQSPIEYKHWEGEIKSQVRKVIKRGTVDIWIQRVAPSRSEFVFDEKAFKKWTCEAKKLAKASGVKFSLNFFEALKIPGIIFHSEKSLLAIGEKALLFKLLSKSLKQLDGERRREGLGLKRDLKFMLRNLKKNIQKISDRFKNQGLSLHVATEEPLSIHEEVIRIKSHIIYMEKLLGLDFCGRKLDFYCQELLREINAIGSKSYELLVKNLVMDCKVLAEDLREQIQNIQ